MFYGNLAQLGNKSNSIIRSRSLTVSKIGVMSDQWRVSLYSVYGRPPECHVTMDERDPILFDEIPVPTIQFP